MLRQPLIMQQCPNELWEGVACDLPAGHKGPHHRAATAEGAALSWRSSNQVFQLSAYATLSSATASRS
jgi:hypothetical protein